MLQFTVKPLSEMPPQLWASQSMYAPIIKALQEAQPGWGILVEHEAGADVLELRRLRVNIQAAIRPIGAKARIDYARRAIWCFMPEHLNAPSGANGKAPVSVADKAWAK